MKIVFWHTRRLAKEFNIPTRRVAQILRLLGAKRWRPAAKGLGSIWYIEVNEN